MYKNLYRTMRGITLLELMIVVVIVSILAIIGYPNYREFAARAKRTEAKSALLQIATNQERFYLSNNTYTDDLTKLGFSTADTDNFITDSGSYRITTNSTATADTYTATATYLNDDAEKSKCLTWTIDAAGTRTSSPDADCWTRTR